MWIRSQNKYTLINTNIIRICEDDRDDCGDYLICAYSNGYDHELGVYSSFEKALKVLDEIQDLIYKACDSGITYEMPKDEDVEL